jgi:hypothetical protein
LLLPNGFSPVHRVFSLSLEIFAQLALHFRESLKGEIGVFFKGFLLFLVGFFLTKKLFRRGLVAAVGDAQFDGEAKTRCCGDAADNLHQSSNVGGHFSELRL